MTQRFRREILLSCKESWRGKGPGIQGSHCQGTGPTPMLGDLRLSERAWTAGVRRAEPTPTMRGLHAGGEADRERSGLRAVVAASYNSS